MPKDRMTRFSKRKKQVKTKTELTWEERDRLYFTEKQCYRLFCRSRWPKGVRCTSCGSDDIYHRKNPVKYTCRSCGTGFSLFTGTYLELVRAPRRTLVLIIFDIVTITHGVSTAPLARCAGFSYRTMDKLRKTILEAMLMDLRRNLVLNGVLEADETSVRCDRPEALLGHRSINLWAGGVRERDADIFIDGLDDRSQDSMHRFLRERTGEDVEILYTDGHKGYYGTEYVLKASHEAVNHSQGEYVRDDAHENGMESTWACLKRNQYGVHHHYWEDYAELYWGERAWILNHRRAGDEFTALVKLLMGQKEKMRPKEERV